MEGAKRFPQGVRISQPRVIHRIKKKDRSVGSGQPIFESRPVVAVKAIFDLSIDQVVDSEKEGCRIATVQNLGARRKLPRLSTAGIPQNDNTARIRGE